jgi:hypothetical protein
MKNLLSLLSVLIMSIMVFSCASNTFKAINVKTGMITGQLMAKEKEMMAGGMVFFFNETSGPPPSATKYWRVPTNAFSIDENGNYNATLPEGQYYMGAIKRFSGGPLGPPQNGDIFFISQDKMGNPKLHTVKKNKTMNMGLISEAVPFNRATLITEGITSIQGTISDKSGNTLGGITVFAFTTPSMLGRPLFVSDRSDKYGKYLLRLSGGGKYYLRARADYGGGPPSADEVMGIYGKGQPITLKNGEIKKGINITVTKVGVPE